MNFKRILAGVMAGATAISLAACSNSGNGGFDSDTNSTASSSETTIDDEIDNPVSIGDISINAGEDVEPAELEYLGNYDITTAGDVKPAYKYFSENYGCKIKCTIVGSLQILEKLTTAISAGESPDLVDYSDSTFPLMMSKNMYTPLDDYMDLSAPQWSGLDQYINKYKWNGKNYYYPWAYNVSSYFLIYNRGVFEQIGLEDPKELYDEGKWTWEAMADVIRKFIDSDTDGNRTGLYGASEYSAQAIIDSTGVPLIEIGEDGKLVSHMNDANIEKCLDMLRSFDNTQEQLRYPRDTENSWNPSYNEWADGNTLFFEDGSWRYEEHWRKFKKKNKWEDDEVNFVPFPQMDGADKYYQSMKQESIMLVAGAKNIDGYKAWIYSNLVASNDPEIAKAGREQSKEEYDWSDTLLDRLDMMKDPKTFTAVFDFKNGIGQDIASTDSQDNPVEQLTKGPYMTGESYTSFRAKYQGQIDTRLAELNKTVE